MYLQVIELAAKMAAEREAQQAAEAAAQAERQAGWHPAPACHLCCSVDSALWLLFLLHAGSLHDASTNAPHKMPTSANRQCFRQAQECGKHNSCVLRSIAASGWSMRQLTRPSLLKRSCHPFRGPVSQLPSDPELPFSRQHIAPEIPSPCMQAGSRPSS